VRRAAEPVASDVDRWSSAGFLADCVRTKLPRRVEPQVTGLVRTGWPVKPVSPIRRECPRLAYCVSSRLLKIDQLKGIFMFLLLFFPAFAFVSLGRAALYGWAP
jgi:hypothetical protein